MGIEIAAVMAAAAAAKYANNRRSANRDQALVTKRGNAQTRDNAKFRNDAQTRLTGAQEKDKGVYSDLYNRYTAAPNAGYQEFANTGGWNPTDTADIEGNIGKWNEIAEGRGSNSTFKEFSETGGYTEDDKSNIRQRIASQTPSVYARLKENMENRRRVSGGFGAGFDEASASMARESARESGSAVREGEIGLSESIRSGRLAGAEGYSRNVQQALGAKNAARMGLVDSRNSGRMFGIEGEEQSRQFGTSGLARLREQGMSGEELQAMDQWLASLGMDERQRREYLERQLGINRQKTENTNTLFSDLSSAATSGMGGRGRSGRNFATSGHYSGGSTW